MADKILNTRIQLKYDTLSNWQTKNTLLKEGEVAFVAIETNVTEGDLATNFTNVPNIMFKVGPGNFNDLKWGSALAADVYDWAKAVGLPINVTTAPEGQFVEGFAWENNKLVPKFRGFITEINEANKDKLDAPTTKAVKDYVDAEVQKAVSGGVEGLATEQYVDDAINALSADGGAIKAVVDDLVAHEQAFSDFQTANTKAISDAVAAEAEIARAAEKANADAIDAIEADYLKAAHLNDYAKTADVPNIKVNNAETADKVANALTVGSKTFDGSAAVEVTAFDLGLESAMHFIGALSAAPDTAKPGDVYLNTATKKEYVYDETNGWVELGDEGSYALRTVTITGTDGLTGGGDLTTNRTIGIADGGVTTVKIADKAVTEAKLADEVTTKLNKEWQPVGNYKVVQTAVSDPAASGKSLTFIDTISQDANGEITATKKNVNLDEYALKSEIPTEFGVMSVTANDTADKQSGIKVDNTDPKNPKVEVDDTITWIFDCGGAE